MPAKTETAMSTETIREQLKTHVYRLAQEIGERNVFHPHALHAAEDYIRHTWQRQGYEVVTQDYTAQEVRSANLEITLRGASRPEQIILVGAHYDTVPGSPGANDNGSGVAALLELSRLLRDATPGCTLRFVAFVNEEAPFFVTRQQGSWVYARAARKRGDDIRLMISLETMGYYRDEAGSQRYPPLFRFFFPDRADFIAFVSNFRSRGKLRKLVAAFRQATDFPLQHVATFAAIPGVAWSDHLSFWLKGYRALMVTDTAFYRYPYYHSAGDTAEKLNYEKLAALTQGLSSALLSLSNKSI
jgi:Zn-dependent M28 family amino/carboxypeptidase